MGCDAQLPFFGGKCRKSTSSNSLRGISGGIFFTRKSPGEFFELGKCLWFVWGNFLGWVNISWKNVQGELSGVEVLIQDYTGLKFHLTGCILSSQPAELKTVMYSSHIAQYRLTQQHIK